MAKEAIENAIENAASEYMRPSVLFKPRVFIDGNQWCALYGDNLQDGVAGFGDSPADAMWDFDAEWNKKLQVEATNRAADVLRDHGFPEIRSKEDKTC